MTAFLGALAGFCIGGVIYGCAALMTGAGHGWGAGCESAWCIFVLPVAGFVFFYRNTRSGRTWHGLTIIATLIVDAIFLKEAYDEGMGIVVRVAKAVPLIFLLWFGLWAGWQVVLVGSFVCKDSVRRREA